MNIVKDLTAEDIEEINKISFVCSNCNISCKRTDDLFGIGFSVDFKEHIMFCCKCVQNLVDLEKCLKSKEYIEFYSKDTVDKHKYIFVGDTFWKKFGNKGSVN